MDALKRETDQPTCTPLVQDWLEGGGGTVAKVDSITSPLEGGRTRCCCTHLNTRRKLCKRIIRKINDVPKLKGKGDFREVIEIPRRSQIPDQMQVPQELEQQRSSKESLEEITQWLKDEVVCVTCVWDMGGIGKTTLVTEIYNRFNATKDFHQVIWVTVSKDLDLEVIQ